MIVAPNIEKLLDVKLLLPFSPPAGTIAATAVGRGRGRGRSLIVAYCVFVASIGRARATV